MKTWSRLLLIVAFSVGMTGCAVAPLTMTGQVESAKSDQGILALKMICARRLSAFNMKWTTLKLKNVQTGKLVEIPDMAPSGAHYSLFLGPVSKGKYQIAGVYAPGVSPSNFGILPAMIIMGMTSDSATLDKEFGSFTVVPGKLTDLGVIAGLPPEKGDASFHSVLLSDGNAQAAVLDDVDPKAATRLQAMRRLGWDKAPNAEAASAALKLFKEQVRPMFYIAMPPDHRILIGGIFGKIDIMGNDGRWSSLSTGTLDTITYLNELSNGRIFAGTDNGRYFVWDPAHDAWLSGSVGGPERSIAEVTELGNAGYVITTTNNSLGIGGAHHNKLLYKASLADPKPAKELLSVDGYSATGLMPVLWTGNDVQFFFNEVGFSRVADRYTINPITLAKKTDRIPHWVMDLYRLPNDEIVMTRINGLSPYHSFSHDNGKTWDDLDVPAPYASHFVDTKTAYGFEKVNTVTFSFAKSVDGGKTWQRFGTTFNGTTAAPLQFVNGRFFVFTGLTLLSTGDNGKTWKNEWPHS